MARAITRVERGGESAREMVRALYLSGGRSYVVGVTGAPGTGKSTLVNELAKEFARRNKSVGIIAVDPSSPFTGGAILGDRLRMQDLTGTGVFIRSMATRGQLGGLAAAVTDAVTVLDGAGFDLILIETVGAGQGEVDIAKNADTTIVLEAPGFGDDIQAIKAGILEIADILLVNKSDREGAQATVAALEMNLGLNKEYDALGRGSSPPRWRPPILKTVALKGEGVPGVADAIERHRAFLEEHGFASLKRQSRVHDELLNLVKNEMLSRTLGAITPEHLHDLVAQVAARQMDIYSAADQIMSSGTNGPG